MPNGPSMYFQIDLSGGPVAVQFGDGMLCFLGTIVRLGVLFNQGGASSYPTSGPPISVQAGILAPSIRRYQAWYRDAVPFCTPSTFNLTNTISVQWLT